MFCTIITLKGYPDGRAEEVMMKKNVGILALFLFLSLVISIIVVIPVHATKYFEYNPEQGNDGDLIPHDVASGVEFCQWGCSSGGYDRGKIVVGSSPRGTRHFRWHVMANQPSAGNEVKNKGVMPVRVALGSTYYLAYFMRYDRIGVKDIWGTTGMSGDKGIEIEGVGVRWALGTGHWGGMADNAPGHYTVWIGNPNPSAGGSGHLNNGSPTWEPTIENSGSDAIYLNQSGYSASNPIQLSYEQWYAVVMKFQFNSKAYAQTNTPDGGIEVWINGKKVASYSGVWLVSQSSGNTIEQIYMHGTIAQNAYNCAEHYRSYSSLLLTDSWQDVVDGGYMGPAPPAAFKIVQQ